MTPGRLRLGLVGLAAATLLWAGAAWAIEPPPSCAGQIADTEARLEIPPRLLTAISLVESGRWDEVGGLLAAWPWTINAGGIGHFFATKDEAVAEVRRLKATGIRNIDVGCMQVNLMYHPDAFVSLEDAFDPATNVAYAGRFLRSLFDATGDWPTAAAFYHSQSPAPAAEYRRLLSRFWPGDGGGPLLASVSARPEPLSLRLRGRVRSPIAVLNPVTPLPWLLPRPVSSPAVDEMRRAWREEVAANRERSQRIAETYRQAVQ